MMSDFDGQAPKIKEQVCLIIVVVATPIFLWVCYVLIHALITGHFISTDIHFRERPTAFILRFIVSIGLLIIYLEGVQQSYATLKASKQSLMKLLLANMLYFLLTSLKVSACIIIFILLCMVYTQFIAPFFGM